MSKWVRLHGSKLFHPIELKLKLKLDGLKHQQVSENVCDSTKDFSQNATNIDIPDDVKLPCGLDPRFTLPTQIDKALGCRFIAEQWVTYRREHTNNSELRSFIRRMNSTNIACCYQSIHTVDIIQFVSRNIEHISDPESEIHIFHVMISYRKIHYGIVLALLWCLQLYVTFASKVSKCVILGCPGDKTDCGK